MWPLSPRSNIIVGIQVTDAMLYFSYFQRNGSTYKLINYHEQPLHRHEILNGIPFKIPQILSYIRNFITSHKLHRPRLAFALDDAWLHPHVETSIRTDNQTSNIIAQYELNSHAWYTVEIAREQLFYYELISLQLSMPCDVITTTNTAGLTALNELVPMKSHEFKHQSDYPLYFQTICTSERLQRVDRNNHIINETALATALGLHIQGSHHS